MAAPRPNGETWRTKWNQYGHYGMAAYRIWQMWDGFMWWQRHEWQREDGQIDMDDWIRSVQCGPGPHYEKVAP